MIRGIKHRGSKHITMDDKNQTQIRSDRRGQSRRQASSASQSDQSEANVPPSPTASLADQGERTSASQTQSRPTRQSPKAQPVPQPQPLLFTGISDGDVEIEIIEEVPAPLPPARKQRLRRTRRWLRSRTGRIVVPLVALVLGLAVGLSSVIWYGLSGEGPLVIVPPAAQGNLVIDANKDFVTQLVRNDITGAGLPGHVQNVTVTLVHGAKMVIQGDDVYPVMFLTITKHFTVDVQPYVQSCVLQIRVTHADLSGIPVTTFVQSFQSKVNQELAKKPAGLPGGFAYCTVGVRTEPGGMFITYQAVPVK